MNSNLEERVGKVRQDQFKSEGERRIAEYLDSYGIRYIYEQGILVQDRGRPKLWHPDFFLPEFAIHIEVYGLAGNKEYDKGIKRKKEVYSQMGLDVIPVYPWTFSDDWRSYLKDNLRGILRRRLKTFAEKEYRKPRLAVPYHNTQQRASGYGRAGGRRYR